VRWAIYVRRSTEEHQETSIVRQLEDARRFVQEREGVVVAEFIDDGISRAESNGGPLSGSYLRLRNGRTSMPSSSVTRRGWVGTHCGRRCSCRTC